MFRCSHHRWLPVVLTLSGTLVAACGCGKSTADANGDTRSLKALGIVYGKYVGAHSGRRPPNEADLRRYATTKESSLLKQLGVADPAVLFVSPRDGQPLTVVYGTNKVSESNPIAGYESQPTKGKRWIVWITGACMEVDESEFQTIKPPS